MVRIWRAAGVGEEWWWPGAVRDLQNSDGMSCFGARWQ